MENSTHIGRRDRVSSPDPRAQSPLPGFEALLPEKCNFELNVRQGTHFLVKARFRARFTSDRLRGKGGFIDVIDQ